MHDALVRLAAGELGTPLTVHRDRSWPHGESTVLEVRDAAGGSWIVKRVSSTKVFDQEVRALRDWAPRLGEGLAPSLAAAVPDSLTLVMDRLPGRAGAATTAAEFHRAGRLIRRLHEVEPVTPDAGYPARALSDLDGWLDRVPGVVGEADVGFVRDRLTELASMPPLRSGPIHNDNQPRNWLTDAGGTVRLIDFGKAKRDVQLRDFERMRNAEWLDRPDLRDAFLDGYGEALSGDDEQALDCISAVGAVSTMLWARAHGDARFEEHGRRTLARLRESG